MNMKTGFANAVEELEEMISELEKETSVHRYCADNNLDYHNHSHYEAGALAALREKSGGENGSGKRSGNSAARKELYDNHVADSGFACYNKIDAAKQLKVLEDRLTELSAYGFWKNLGREFKTGVEKAKASAEKTRKWLGDEWDEAKEKGGRAWEEANEQAEKAYKTADRFVRRRIIINKSNEKICVTGNDSKGNPMYVYLRPGETSTSKNMYDADGVVILKGQWFYDNKNCAGEAQPSGVIQVHGNAGMGNAEVYESKNNPGKFYVNAMRTEYHNLGWAKDVAHWKLP